MARYGFGKRWHSIFRGAQMSIIIQKVVYGIVAVAMSAMFLTSSDFVHNAIGFVMLALTIGLLLPEKGK